MGNDSLYRVDRGWISLLSEETEKSVVDVRTFQNQFLYGRGNITHPWDLSLEESLPVFWRQDGAETPCVGGTETSPIFCETALKWEPTGEKGSSMAWGMDDPLSANLTTNVFPDNLS